MKKSGTVLARPPCFQAVVLMLLGLAASFPCAAGQSSKWGGSVRGYPFVRLQETPLEDRRDAEFFSLRLTARAELAPGALLEGHGVFNLLSPPLAGASRLASAPSRSFLPLQDLLLDDARASLFASLDRLNVQIRAGPAKVVLGRQPVSWGVGYFWPAMDLFAPFAPQQVDRDYKPGVDAVRVTLPLGSYSEIDALAAVLGTSLARDGAAGVLARIHLGAADLGVMGGRFHGDTVGGGFLAANVKGTGVRAEAVWTRSGDPEDRLRGRERFWRGMLGVDRQLTPDFSLAVELAWNGYGTGSADYEGLLTADRILRGEVNALGRFYSGVSGSWRLHPLWNFSNAALVNWGDPSCLWVPALIGSTGNNSEVLLGGQFGFGARQQGTSLLGSEYGALSHTLFAGFKVYF
ncbi:MAG: hypothetical protein HYX74_04130 [Acidobacteria bacterium]|nr:hypothetical protein [Acidobacteriota bacterium]